MIEERNNLDETIADRKAREAREQIILKLLKNGGSVTGLEIAKYISNPRENLLSLIKHGFVKKTTENTYEITDSGEKALENFKK